MGLFDSVLSAVSSHLQQQGGLATVLSSLLANNGELGGLSGLIQKFNQAGLGDVISSWIGKGQNLPISADQLSAVVGQGTLDKAASQSGLDASQLASQLAVLLPGLIDRLTPDGSAPQGGLGNTGDLLGMLGGMLQK